MADIELDNLIVRDFTKVSSEVFKQAVESGEIGENDLNFTKFMPANLWIFYPAWADHEVDDMSWLCANTFSWHPSDPYIAGYEKLVNAITDAEQKTDTIGDITITYYQKGDNGLKVCMPDQESNLVALYEATGVAWYYLLDQTNQQFKLPRTQWGFTGLRDSVGGYVAPTLPNITGTAQPGSGGYTAKITNLSGAFVAAGTGAARDIDGSSSSNQTIVIGLDASASDPTYQNGATVQPPATQMYLYFYVGNFEQDAVEQTAGLNAELFNNKADRNLLNTTDNVDIVIESQLPTADNGYTWYRKYKSGWVEQGGQSDNSSQGTAYTVTLPVPMQNANYTAMVTGTATGNGYIPRAYDRTTTTFQIRSDSFSTGANPTAVRLWYVCGMAA